ncbi:hypothetical protein WT31_03210 [Burkholderia territorii]|nr:hypothetical protein WT31_03210 [Burkholderia territorii]
MSEFVNNDISVLRVIDAALTERDAPSRADVMRVVATVQPVRIELNSAGVLIGRSMDTQGLVDVVQVACQMVISIDRLKRYMCTTEIQRRLARLRTTSVVGRLEVRTYRIWTRQTKTTAILAHRKYSRYLYE